jgi:hypothetical protein
MTLHGVTVEVEDDSAMRDMAECFIEEFGRMGFSEEKLLRVFREPAYAGPHLAYLTFGEAWVADLIGEYMALRGPGRPTAEPTVNGESVGVVRLRVLET